MIVRLRDSGAFEQTGDVDLSQGIPDFLAKRARFVYVGKFNAMDGPVEVKKEHLEKLVANYNGRMAKLKRLAKGTVGIANRPVQLDHGRSARDTVGRLQDDDLTIEDYEVEPGLIVPAVYGRLKILGRENVEKVLDGRWQELSLSFDHDGDGSIDELSITPFPAAGKASLLSNPSNDKGHTTMKFKDMEVRLRKWFRLGKKLTDEETEDKMKKLEAEDDPAELKKLSEEMDDDEKKEKEKKDKDDEEAKGKKLMAAKTSIATLATDFRARSKGAMLAAKTSRITHRLSALRSSGKITPAEIKTIKLSELAEKSDETVDEVLKSYDARQPVIMTGAFGSMKAMSHGDLQSMAKRKRLSAIELESRSNMTSVKRLSTEERAAMDDDVNIHIPTDRDESNTDLGEMEGEYNEVCKMVDEGKVAEVKERLKGWMGRMSGTGGYAMSEPTLHEETGKQLSALQADVAHLQAKFEEAIGLAESLATGT